MFEPFFSMGKAKLDGKRFPTLLDCCYFTFEVKQKFKWALFFNPEKNVFSNVKKSKRKKKRKTTKERNNLLKSYSTSGLTINNDVNWNFFV